MKLVVIKKFQDKETKKLYQPGTEITHFSDERAKDVIRRKLVVEVKPVLTDIDMSKGAKEVISQIADFADVESALEKPRVTVVNAIQARLEELKK